MQLALYGMVALFKVPFRCETEVRELGRAEGGACDPYAQSSCSSLLLGIKKRIVDT